MLEGIAPYEASLTISFKAWTTWDLTTWFTGNDLGKLGGIEQLPDETEVNEFKLIELSDLFITHEDDAKKLEQLLHKKAKEYLNIDELENAWKTLLSFNN